MLESSHDDGWWLPNGHYSLEAARNVQALLAQPKRRRSRADVEAT